MTLDVARTQNINMQGTLYEAMNVHTYLHVGTFISTDIYVIYKVLREYKDI